MTVRTQCPGRDKLQHLLSGECPESQAAEIETHVAACSQCLEQVRTLTPHDTLLLEAAGCSGPVQEILGETVDEQLLARLCRLRPSPRVESPMVQLSGILAPPQGAGEIGRLGGYRVVQVLGAGGMGVVLRAEDVQLQRPVALKVMRPAFAQHAVARERFLREARATAAVRHPHVVTIHQVGGEGDVPFLAMELLEGETLEERLQREGWLPLAEVLRIGRETVEGLAAAHAKGLIHRDVKPSNLWLEAGSDQVKILDFGLARAGDSEAAVTQEGMIVGTPAYMAPEQARAEKVDHRADLFSLGAVLYRLATGRLPFRGDNTLSLLTALAVETPTPPCALNPAIPPRLSALIERLLAKDREQRPGSAKAVADELAAIEREAGQSEPKSPAQQASHGSPPAVPAVRSRRQPPARRWLVAAGLVALLGVTLGIVVIIRNRDGTKVAEVSVPPGGSVEIKDKGESQAKQQAAKGQVNIEPEPLAPLEPGTPLSLRAFVTQPAKLPGVRSWSIALRQAANPSALAFRPDGQRLAVTSWDGGVHIWEAKTGRLVQVILTPRGTAVSVAWSPDGRVLAVGTGGTRGAVHLWDAATGRLLRALETPDAESISALVWSPDGRLIRGWGTNRHCYTWEAGRGKRLHALPIVCPCDRPCFSTDGKRLAAPMQGNQVVIWDTETGKEVNRLTAPGEVWNLAWSGTGKRLASGGSEGLCVWDVDKCKEVFRYPRASQRTDPPAWSPDGLRVTFTSSTLVTEVLEVGGAKQPVRLQEAGGCLAWSPDGSTIACVGGEPWVRLYDAATGARLQAVTEGAAISGIALSPHGRTLARSERFGTFLASADTGQVFRELKQEAWPIHQVNWPMAWSPDGKQLAAHGPNNTVQLWQTDGKVQFTLADHSAEVTSLVWSPDGKRLASAAAGERRVVIWDVVRGKRDRELGPFTAEAQNVRWRRDGKSVTFNVPGAGWHVWDVEANKLVNEPNQWKVFWFDLAPDGRWALVAPTEKDAYRLRDLASGKEGLKLPHAPHPYLAHPLWSPDGTVLAVSGFGGMELWSPDLTRRLRTLPLEIGATQVAFSKDSKRLAAQNGERVYFWETDTGRPCGLMLLGRRNNELTITPDGHYTGNENVDRSIVMVVEKDDGTQETLEPAEFRRKYGFQNDPNRVHLLAARDHGADVGEVATTKDARGGVTERSAPLPDHDKPFLLIRKAGKREEFKHLTGALAVLRDGDSVEVHGNGPFTLPAMRIEHARAVLKAAPGYRPQFVAALPVGEQRAWFYLGGGAVLEGCDFQVSKWMTAFAGRGDWEVRNCRFCITAVGHFLWHGGPHLLFTDCLLFSTSGTIFELAAKDQVELTNNVIVAAPWPKGILCLSAPGGQTVRCSNNTMICYPQEGIFLPAAGCTEPMVIEAAGNLFQGGRAVPDNQAAAGLRWQGRDNLYVGPEVLRAAGADGKWGPANLAAWTKRWGHAEEGSRQVERVAFRLDALRELPASEALPQVRVLAARMLKEGGVPTGVGPDWDLVGPGEAYLRALAADKGERGPSAPRLDRLRPPALPGGPFVLIHAGKEQRGYVGLQEALYAAKKDDVIEIRTDGPFPGGSIPDLKKETALTVRAAPGYRPVVTGSIHNNSSMGDLRLEGLTFEEARLTGSYRNLSVRNCAFRQNGSPNDVAIGVFGDGQAVEFRNCVTSRFIAATLENNRTILLDNCLAGGVALGPDQPGTVLVRRCVLWNPDLPGGLFYLSHSKLARALRAEHTLFVSGGYVIGGGYPTKWVGQGNVYSVGGPWFWVGSEPDLQAWQKKLGSDADARELPPLLLDAAQWQLLPGQPQTPAARDYGADVRRVVATKDARGTVTELRTSPLPDHAKPFLLIRKAGKREEFKHLTGALAVLQEGDAIEVYGNGPFTVPPVRVDRVRVVLKAAAGYRPQFVAPRPAQLHTTIWFNLLGGAVLEGCDFRAIGTYSAVAGAGDWHVRNCRFFVTNLVSLCMHTDGRVRFTDCVLLGDAMTIFHLGAKDAAELTNNVILGAPWPKGVVSFAAPGGQVVSLTRNTLVCFAQESMFRTWSGCTEPIVIEAVGNLLQGSQAVPDGVAAATFRWKGRDNLYVGPEVLRVKAADGKWEPADLAAWNRRWNSQEEGSRQVEHVWFRLDALQQLPTADALPQVQALATAMLRGLRRPGQVGPDWDLVGPGEAYVRALAADKGERGPSAPRLDRLRPEPLPGGPFILIRAGKEQRGYVRLHDAFAAAQKDDVIEIRTDGPFAGGVIPGVDRDMALTVRAAPGYRPVVTSQVLHQPRQGDFRLEGLTFDETRADGYFRNLSVRNCAFRTTRFSTNMGFNIVGDGQPVEFRNTVVSHAISVAMDQSRTLLVDNCVSGAVNWQGMKEGHSGAVLVRRSALWYPGPRGGLMFRPKSSASIRAERNLMVSGYYVTGISPSKWEGAGNVYSIRGPWLSDGHFGTLGGWQQMSGSDADAQELPPLLLEPALWQLLPGQPQTPAGQDYGACVSANSGKGSLD